MLELNLTAPFRLLRRALPGMVEQGWGRVVAVASIAAKRGDPYVSAYTASKHGLLGLVRSAAAEVATTGRHGERRVPGVRRHPDDRGTRSRRSAPPPGGPRTRRARRSPAASRSGG